MTAPMAVVAVLFCAVAVFYWLRRVSKDLPSTNPQVINKKAVANAVGVLELSIALHSNAKKRLKASPAAHAYIFGFADQYLQEVGMQHPDDRILNLYLIYEEFFNDQLSAAGMMDDVASGLRSGDKKIHKYVQEGIEDCLDWKRNGRNSPMGLSRLILQRVA